MEISHADLKAAARSAGINDTQTDALWAALSRQPSSTTRARFDFAHVAYYLGALIVMGAMGWFVTNGWDSFAGWQLSVIALCYAGCFLWVGHRIWDRPFMRIPGGLLITSAVGMVPLAVFGIEKSTGFWPDLDPGSYTHFHPYIDASWIIMELATAAAGLFALRRWRFPFLTAPIAYALWYLSMDLPALLFVRRPYSWEEKQFVTMAFGFVMLAFAYAADLRGRKDVDLAFWGYLFGLAAFWGGLTSMDSGSELGKFIYCLINLALIGLSLFLRRRVFIVFGSMGLFAYLWHLADRVFADSILFPFALSLIGIGVIVVGVQYHRRRAAIEAFFESRLAPSLRNFIPPRTRDDAA